MEPQYKKKKIVLENLKIEKYAGNGKGLAKVDNKVVFVRHAVVGDVAKVQIIKNRKQWMEGEVMQLTHPSPLRIKPKCEHFGFCGGCSLQMIPYQKQLEYKQQEVIDKFKQIAHTTLPNVLSIVSADTHMEYEYRNKLEFSCSNNRFLLPEEMAEGVSKKYQNSIGFHISGFYNQILNIDHCHLMLDEHNQIRNFIRQYCNSHSLALFHRKENKGFLRNFIIRKNRNNEYLMYFIFCDDLTAEIEKFLHTIQQQFDNIKSIFYSYNKKLNDSIYDLDIHHYSRQKYIIEQMGNYSFYITPKSFFQTNTYQSEKLYQRIVELCAFSKKDIVYDLYCGSATISIYISQYVKKVYGIEVLEEAIQDAQSNIALNKVNNVVVHKIDLAAKQQIGAMKQFEQADVCIVDPPRNGLSKYLIQFLLEHRPKKIVYVSCNPATQARDFIDLQNYYSINISQAVDMFPQTYHIENILLLTLKDDSLPN